MSKRIALLGVIGLVGALTDDSRGECGTDCPEAQRDKSGCCVSGKPRASGRPETKAPKEAQPAPSAELGPPKPVKQAPEKSVNPSPPPHEAPAEPEVVRVCAVGLERCSDRCVSLATSRRHCGGCGHDCGDDACRDGRCVPVGNPVVIARDYEPRGLRVDDTNVYWYGGSAIMRAPKSGGAPKEMVIRTDYFGYPWNLVVDADSLYFPHVVNGGIYRVAK